MKNYDIKIKIINKRHDYGLKVETDMTSALSGLVRHFTLFHHFSHAYRLLSKLVAFYFKCNKFCYSGKKKGSPACHIKI